jgi:antirestriction protein ArdC
MKSSNTSSPRQDLYTRVTTRIIADLESGVRPWLKPWSGDIAADRIGLLPLRHNGIPYRGMNILLLWDAAMDAGFTRNIWMTYRQANEIGAQVRKGEHGSMVVYADRFTRTDTNDAGEAVDQEIPFLKAYTVFNVEQIDALPAQYCEPPTPRGETLRLIEEAEDFFAATGATIRHGGNRAFYARVLI